MGECIKVLFLWCLASQLCAATDMVILDPHTSVVKAISTVEFFEDPSRQLTAGQILSPSYSERFQRNQKERLNFGHSRSVFWVRFTVVNQSDLHWYLLLDTRLSDPFGLYIFPADAPAPANLEQSTQAYIDPVKNYPRKAWHLSLPENVPLQVLMRVSNGDSVLNLPIEFLTEQTFVTRSLDSYWLLGGLFSALIALAVFQFLMYINLREPSYLILGFHVLMMVFSLHAGNPIINSLKFIGETDGYFYTAPTLLALASGFWFAHSLLDIPRYSRLWSLLYKAMIVLSLGLIAVVGLIPGGAVVPMYVGTLLYVFALSVSLFIAFKGSKIALYYFLIHLVSVSAQSINWWLQVFRPEEWSVQNNLSLFFAEFILILPMTWVQSERVRILRSQVLKNEAENQAKDEFMAKMSHELRTPLHAIIGLGGLLRLGTLDAKQQAYIEKLNSAAHQQLQLVSSVLDFAKVNNSAFTPENQAFRLDIAVHSVIGLMNQSASQKGIALALEYSGESPEFSVLGDRVRLSQVLINLLGNAIKYTHFGTVTLSIDIQRAINGCSAVRFEVLDTGPGMTAMQLNNLFEPFSQLSLDGKLPQSGVGLGLVISKDLVEAMGGKLTVKSIPDEGSQFTFSLNFEPTKNQQKNTKELQITDLSLPEGLRVLVVDDSEPNRFICGEMLSNMGIEAVEFAPGGEEAILQLQLHDFDVMLLDISMPDVDGYEVTRWLRKYGRNVDLPVIALTAYSKEQVMAESKDAGMNDVLCKPFQYEALHSLIRSVY